MRFRKRNVFPADQFDDEIRRLKRGSVMTIVVLSLMAIFAGYMAVHSIVDAVAGEDPFSMNRMYAGACIKAIKAMEKNEIGEANDHLLRALERGGYICEWEEWDNERYFDCRTRDKAR